MVEKRFGRIFTLFRKVFEAAPAAAPLGIGDIFDRFRSDASADDMRALLDELTTAKQSRESTEALERELKLTREKVDLIIELIKESLEPHDPPHDPMVVVIPAGGRGGSMFPLTSVMPKCLVTVGKKPLLQHILDSFIDFQNVFKKVIVVTRDFDSAIRESVRQRGYDGFVECRRIDKNVPAAIQDLEKEISRSPLLLHYNDILIPEIDWDDVHKKYQYLRRNRNIVGMLLCSSYYPMRIGIIREGQPGLLESFEEKPAYLKADAYANMGVAVFHPDLLNHIRSRDAGIFEKTFPRLLRAKAAVGLYRVAEWAHIHELNDLYNVQRPHSGRRTAGARSAH